MDNIGWIKLHRKLKDNPISTNIELLGFLTYILLDVNHKENSFYVGTTKVTLQPGEKLFSQVKLAKQFGLSRNTIRSYLTILQKEGIVTIKGYSKYSILKLLNWNLYQVTDQQTTSRLNSRLNTNKNVKNVENEKETTQHHASSKLETPAKSKQATEEEGVLAGVRGEEDSAPKPISLTENQQKLATYWNDIKGWDPQWIQYRKITPNIKKALVKVFKTYTLDDIHLGLMNYKYHIKYEQSKSKTSYKDHRFSFEKFLTQKNGLEEHFNKTINLDKFPLLNSVKL